MKKYLMPSVIILMLLPGVVFSELFDRAPDVLPGTITDMRTPEFWIYRMAEPDEVILTPAVIEDMNRRYREWSHGGDPFSTVPEEQRPRLSYWWPGIVLAAPDLESLDAGAVADTVRSRILDEIAFVNKKDFGGFDAVRHPRRAIDRFIDEMALDRVPERIVIRHAITVRTTRLRNVPTFFPMEMGMIDTGPSRIEQFNITVLRMAEHVRVLHRSRSGMHVFVLADFGYGWVRTEDVAFGTKDEIEAFIDAEPFVVCTADLAPFYGEESAQYASGSFRMAERLPLADGGGSRRILTPVREADGSFGTVEAWLAEDADVHLGWLPYTRRNVVETAFKLLDTPYDWTGSWLCRQHERLFRDIFGCFGFDLPHHAGLFPWYGDDRMVLSKEAGLERQYETILGKQPFTTIMSCGSHCQLYLGEYEGRPIVFQTHGYGYESEDGGLLLVKRACVSDMRMPTYFLKNDITFLALQ